MTIRTLDGVVTAQARTNSDLAKAIADIKALKAADVRLRQAIDGLDVQIGTSSSVYTPAVYSQVELEAAISAAITEAGGEGATLVLPAGIYEFTDTLRTAGIRSLKIVGQGLGTKWVWAGPADRPFVEFDGCQFCGLENIWMTFSTECLEGIRTTDTWSNNGSHPLSRTNLRSEGQEFTNVFIDGVGLCQTGWNNRLGPRDGKNDQHVGTNLKIRGCVECLLNVEGQSARNIQLKNPIFQGYMVGNPSFFCRVGIRTGVPRGGSIHVIGGVVMNNELDLEIGDRSGPWTFVGTWFEQSQMWLRARDNRHRDAAQAEFQAISFLGCRWSARADEVIASHRVVDARVSGLSFRDLQFGLNEPTWTPKIHVEPLGPGATFTWENCRVSTLDKDGLFTGRYPTSTKGSFLQLLGGRSEQYPTLPRIDQRRPKPQLAEDWQALGIPCPRSWHLFQEETKLAAWLADTDYEEYDEVTNSNKRYLCITGGTSAASGGPTTSLSVITDGTVEWKYLGLGSGVVYDHQQREQRVDLILDNGCTLREEDDTLSNGFFGGLTQTLDEQFRLDDDLAVFDPRSRSQRVWIRARIDTMTLDNFQYLWVMGSGTTAAAGGPLVYINQDGRIVLALDGVLEVGAGHVFGGADELYDFAIDYNRESTVFACTVFDADGVQVEEVIHGTWSTTIGYLQTGRGLGSNGSTRTSFLGLVNATALWAGPIIGTFTRAFLLGQLAPIAVDASADPPVASFTAAQTAGTLTQVFTDTSVPVSPATIASRLWDFGDGATSTSTNPSHTYAAAGDYLVTLTVADSNGNEDSHSETVTVRAVIVPASLISTTGSSANITTYSTASVTPTADRLVLVAMAISQTVAALPTTIEGCGLTWFLVKDADGTEATVTWTTGVRRLAVYAAIGAAPSADTIDLVFGANLASILLGVAEYAGVDLGFDEVTETFTAIEQVTVNTAAAATSITGTLAALEHANNHHFYACGLDTNVAITVGGGFTQLSEGSVVNDSIRLELAGKLNDTTADPSFTESNAAIVSIELRSA